MNGAVNARARSVSRCMVVRLSLSLLGLSAAARAHEALFEPASFGWTTDSYELSWPLTGARYGSHWLFRGLNDSTAQGSIALVAGRTIDLEIGCSRANVEDKHEACADDPGSLHSIGGARTGCRLAISYKRARTWRVFTYAAAFADIGPADLVVFSVLHDCVHEASKHTFAVPSNLPATPEGQPATCAFGWVPSACLQAAPTLTPADEDSAADECVCRRLSLD